MKKYRNLAVKSTACILSAVMLFGSGFSAAAAGSDIPKDENLSLIHIYSRIHRKGFRHKVFWKNGLRGFC